MTNKSITVKAELIDRPKEPITVSVKVSKVPVKQKVVPFEITNTKTGKTRIQKVKVWGK